MIEQVEIHHTWTETERFSFRTCGLAGLWHVRSKILEDERGHFARLFCAEEFLVLGLEEKVAQVNLSFNLAKGTVRGLHFQYPPPGEYKLVRCISGRVLDFVVDLRASSETFMQWHVQELDAAQGDGLLIPPGLAHGFQTLDDDVRMIYLHSCAHDLAREGGLRFDDARILPPLPGFSLPVAAQSGRDRSWPDLGPDFEGLVMSLLPESGQ